MATNDKSAVCYILAEDYINWDRCIDFSECQRIDYASDVSDSEIAEHSNLRNFKKYKLYVVSLEDLLKLSMDIQSKNKKWMDMLKVKPYFDT